ncbi:MAG: glycoside hydrolase domain-containing protein [Bacteroidota bacterium]
MIRKNLHRSTLFHLIFPILFGLSLHAAPPDGPPAVGYRIMADETCVLWWAEGTYKIMRDDPAPVTTGTTLLVFAARNEYESFQLILRPSRRMDDVHLEITDLVGKGAARISAANISVRHVGYVNVSISTDGKQQTGSWPDPLPPYEGPFTAYGNENSPLWITVYVPANTAPGLYEGTVIVRSGKWSAHVPLRLNVFSFTLPEHTHIRSSFGISPELIKSYHNLETDDEVRQVTDLYYRSMKDHRICPTTPTQLYPMLVTVSGANWEGGEYISDHVHGGRRALKLADESPVGLAEARTKQRIVVRPDRSYELSWFAATAVEGQEYTVLVECFNHEGECLPFQNKLGTYQGSTNWKQEKMMLRNILPDVGSVAIHLYATFKDAEGTRIGTTFFDDIEFKAADSPENLLTDGDFEFDIDKVNVEIDFSEFDKGARKYLDELGFNSYNLPLEGLPSGTFYSQSKGVFHGFRQGTPEYAKLMKQYLSQVQDHLEKNGWLGKEYVYWFDEPDEKSYAFVREGMEILHTAAPKLTRFITEMAPGPDIMDVTEISCTIWHHVDSAVIAGLVPKGRQFWSYLCCQPRSPWISLFIDKPAVNLRVWLWMSYQYRLSGILVWSSTYWNSPEASPKGHLQNPWADPMSYVTSYGQAQGQISYWGNGDGRFFYPPNRDPDNDKRKYLTGPVPSLRLELLREGLEDYEYFILLENAIKNLRGNRSKLAEEGKSLLHFPGTVFKNGQDYNTDPQPLLEHRLKIARLLEEIGQ